MKTTMILIAILLAGCSRQNERPDLSKSGYKLVFIDDEEYGIRCYRFEGHEGTSCLKVKPSNVEQKIIEELTNEESN